MKFSVITVCFNSSDTIGASLESVICQNYPNVEHIVIDGASTDGTLDAIRPYEVHLANLISEQDGGIYDAMNKGLEKATGDILCFLNADDQYVSNNVLSRVAKIFIDKKLDAVIADTVFFRPPRPTKIVRRYRSDYFKPERLAWGWMPAHPGLFLRRTVTDRVGYFKTDYQIAGDYEYIIRAFHGQNLNYKYLPEIVVKMQSGGASTAGLRAKIQLNKEVLRACRENGIKTNLIKILSKYPAKLLETILK